MVDELSNISKLGPLTQRELALAHVRRPKHNHPLILGKACLACHPDLTPGQRFESGYFQLLEGDLEMARKGKSTEEIVGFLREAEVRISQGETVGKICRSIGVSEQTYYKRRREYGGLKIDQARRLKDLERENDRLKRAVSELTLDKLILKEALSGKY